VVLAMVWSFRGVSYLSLINRNDLSYAGQISEKIIAPDLSIASSEINTFGMMIPNREIIDLWGYTNPEIAKSKKFNPGRYHHNPDYFLKIKPDVFWVYQSPVNFADIENFVSNFDHFTHFKLLGDMNKVMDKYYPVLIHHPKKDLFYFVKKASFEKFESHLIENGYRLNQKRKWGEACHNRPSRLFM
jgi:hypothetical protein